MRIYAFDGIRYHKNQDPGSLAGPPYDQIDTELQHRLHENPRHFAHLIRPAGEPESGHRAAAELHANWLDSRVLARDHTPSLYPYEIEMPDGNRRLGLGALIGLEEPDSGVIRPHEATMTKTVDERLALLRTTRIDFEPILLLAEDEGALNRLLDDDLRESHALVAHRDITGYLHKLHQIEDEHRIDVYRQALAGRVGLIADGHHRYTVASRFARETHAESGSPATAKLAVITSLASPGLQIDPIHRQVSLALDVDSVAHLAASHHAIAGATGAEIAAAVAAAPQPSLGISVGDRTELWTFDRATSGATLPEHLQHLAVGWLHELLLPELGLAPTAATDGTVVYRSDPETLHSELRDGSAAVGFWLPPMSGDDFARAMEGGSLLPPKSTRFLPKVASGLVWSGHDARIE